MATEEDIEGDGEEDGLRFPGWFKFMGWFSIACGFAGLVLFPMFGIANPAAQVAGVKSLEFLGTLFLEGAQGFFWAVIDTCRVLGDVTFGNLFGWGADALGSDALGSAARFFDVDLALVENAQGIKQTLDPIPTFGFHQVGNIIGAGSEAAMANATNWVETSKNVLNIANEHALPPLMEQLSGAFSAGR